MPESTEPPTQLREDLSPVPVKYVPLPNPILPTDIPATTVTANDTMRPPCRRCLLDARPGERLHLYAYDPFPPDSVTPYRGNGPIFVHEHSCKRFEGDTLPERQLRRQMSVRAYNDQHFLMAAKCVNGNKLESTAGQMLADDKAGYIMVHNAGPGCFTVRMDRA